MSQFGRPCKQCGSPIDKLQGRKCRKCYNQHYYDQRHRAIRPLVFASLTSPPYDCACGQIECDTCGDRMLQSLLDKRPAAPPEPRSYIGIPQAT